MANTLDKIKISGVTYDIIDATAVHSLDGYYTSGQTNDAITAATAALAETIGQEMSAKTDNDDFTAYTAATDAVLTGKADTTAVTADISAATSGKVDNDTYTAYTAATDTVLGAKADSTAVTAEISAAVSGTADAAEYDSDAQLIKFYHGGTGGSVVYSVDATDFVKDGFLSAVTLENRTVSGESVPCLVFEWNTDAGVQETVIPVGGIFDPSNYYDKDATDAAISAATSGKVENDTFTAYTASTEAVITGKADTTAVTEAISEATSGKADTTAVTAINDVLTGHTADTTIHVTSADKTEWSGKQDALVSGTNIKTVNGNSLLGSGDVTVQGLPTVSGTTLIFS